ncbi:hypothetical protein SDC9_142865 [bioreactor metagenome]|uniref:Uncharacterized protein n=1 Tax=bioreactor metagenome TaxID=1076179 RepID=A0A645E1T1_9ZZZZ
MYVEQPAAFAICLFPYHYQKEVQVELLYLPILPVV